jgi:hypothetical protein
MNLKTTTLSLLIGFGLFAIGSNAHAISFTPAQFDIPKGSTGTIGVVHFNVGDIPQSPFGQPAFPSGGVAIITAGLNNEACVLGYYVCTTSDCSTESADITITNEPHTITGMFNVAPNCTDPANIDTSAGIYDTFQTKQLNYILPLVTNGGGGEIFLGNFTITNPTPPPPRFTGQGMNINLNYTGSIGSAILSESELARVFGTVTGVLETITITGFCADPQSPQSGATATFLNFTCPVDGNGFGQCTGGYTFPLTFPPIDNPCNLAEQQIALTANLNGQGNSATYPLGTFTVSSSGINTPTSYGSSTIMLDTIMPSILATFISFITGFITTFWPFILVFGIVAGFSKSILKFINRILK